MKTAIVLAIAYLVSIVITPATTLLFDELSPSNLPTNYSGFQWSGWLVANDAPILPPNLYSNAIVSPHNVIGNIDGRSTTLGNGPAFLFFNLNSAYLTAEYNDGLQIEVQGFSGGAMVYDNTYTINATSPSFVQFDYQHVNAIKFISSGGTLHPGYPAGGAHLFNFALDNLSLEIPEPATGTLCWLGVAIGLRRLRRRR